MAQNKSTHIGNDLGLKRVLIARFSALGNVVMTIPVVYSACLCYPDVKFVMLTRQSMQGLFVNKPDNLEIEPVDLATQCASPAQSYKLIAQIKKTTDFDAFIDLQNDRLTSVMRLYCHLHRIPTSKFNKAEEHKRGLTRRENKVMLPMASARARYREAFFQVGLPLEEEFNGIYGHEGKGDPELFAEIVGAPRTPGQKWIGIAPFAAYAEKEYPTERMQEVIEMLVADPKHRIFIFGGDGREKEIAMQWAQKWPQVTSLAGEKHGFAAEFSLLSHLDLMITMDSANMHLASIVGLPIISIWGATHSYCGYNGWHQTQSNMLQLPLSCRPCSLSGDKPCYRHDRLCLTALRPDFIYNKAIELLTPTT